MKKKKPGRPRFLAFQLDARRITGAPEFVSLGPDGLGVYIRLIAFAWQNAGDKGPVLPNRDKFLAMIAGVSDYRWSRMRDRVLALFHDRDGQLIPIGLDVQFERSVRRSTRQKTPIPPSMRFSVLQRDGFRCVYCGRTSEMVELHVDHVHPCAMGGPTEMGNLVTACWECNIGKADAPVLVKDTGQVQ